MSTGTGDYKTIALQLVRMGYRIPDGEKSVDSLLIRQRNKQETFETERAKWRASAIRAYRYIANDKRRGWEFQDIQYHGSMHGAGEW